MKPSWLVNFIAFFFILLFLYTGAIKLLEVNSFKEELVSSPLLGSMAGFVAWALPIGEMLLAIVLFIPAWRIKGLYASGILMTLFTGYVSAILIIDNHISCSCGGIIENLSPRQHLVFNSACIVLSMVGIVDGRRRRSTTRFNWIATSSALLLFLLVGWTLFTAFTAPATIKTGLEGRLLPSFEILLPDSTTRLNTASIATGSPLVFIGFSPFCKHCQQETAKIIANMDRFKNARFYWVTSYPFDQMKTFYYYYKLAKYPNVTIGFDIKDYFLPYFKADGVPYTAVFDSKKRLKQVIGNFDIDELTKALVE